MPDRQPLPLPGVIASSPSQSAATLREVFAANLAAVDRVIELAGEPDSARVLFNRHRDALTERRAVAERQGMTALAAQLTAELAELDRQIAWLVNPGAQASTPGDALLPVAPPRPPVHTASVRSSWEANLLTQAPAPPPTGGSNRTRLDYRNDMAALAREGDELEARVASLHPVAIRSHIQILAARTRLLQDEFAERLLRLDWEDEAFSARFHFGRLSRLASAHLNPHGMYARGIKRNARDDWHALIQSSEKALAELESGGSGGGGLTGGEPSPTVSPTAVEDPLQTRVTAACAAVSADPNGKDAVAELKAAVVAQMAGGEPDDWLVAQVAPLRKYFARGEDFKALRAKLKVHADPAK
jgi:hypothetical protein